MLAPSIPQFSRQWSLSEAQAGFFFTSQYLTSLFGVIASSWLLGRYTFSKVLGFGFVFITAGMAFLGVSPWFLTALCVAVFGFGYGLANPTTNLRATQLPSGNVAAAVSLLNFSWSVGAVACPRLVALAGIRGVSVVVAILSLVLGAVHFASKQPGVQIKATPKRHTLEDWKGHLKVSQAAPLLALFFLYVGTEVSIGGWVAAALGRRVPGASAELLANAPFAFYGFLLIGRGVAPVLLRRFSTIVLSAGGMLCAAAGTALIVLTHSYAALIVGACLAGFGCAPQYPIFVTWLAQIFKKDADWLGALFFGGGGLGGAFLPWIVGIIAARSGSLIAGFLLPLVTCLIMGVLALRAYPGKPANEALPA